MTMNLSEQELVRVSRDYFDAKERVDEVLVDAICVLCLRVTGEPASHSFREALFAAMRQRKPC